MTRTVPMLLLLVGRIASGEERPAPPAAPISEARQALLERARAPSGAARLPVLGVDPLRRSLRAAPGPGPAALPRRADGMAAADGRRAREAAERAAQRARGEGPHGPGRRGPPGGREPGAGERDGPPDGTGMPSQGPPPDSGGGPGSGPRSGGPGPHHP